MLSHTSRNASILATFVGLFFPTEVLFCQLISFVSFRYCQVKLPVHLSCPRFHPAGYPKSFNHSSQGSHTVQSNSTSLRPLANIRKNEVLYKGPQVGDKRETDHN